MSLLKEKKEKMSWSFFMIMLDVFIFTIFYYLEIERSPYLVNFRSRCTWKEKLNDDKIIYCVIIIHCLTLLIDLENNSSIYNLFVGFLVAFTFSHIVSIYLDMFEKDQKRCEKLRELLHENYTLRSNQGSRIPRNPGDTYLARSIARKELSDIQDFLFDLKEDIPEGKYIDIMNKTKKINNCLY